MLCILIQDYPSLRSHCIKSLLKKHDELLAVLSHVQDFATSSYLVELISQLENKALISSILRQNAKLHKNFPETCYANDSACLKFLQLTEFHPSIYKLRSFSLGSNLKCEQPYCQLTSRYLIALVEHNDYWAPIQIDFSNIRNLQYTSSQLRFNLAEAAKKALINIDTHESVTITLDFDSGQICKSFVSECKELCGSIVVLTPQKISVVQDFISLSGGFGGMEDDEDIENPMSQSDDNLTLSIKDVKNESSNSGLIDETESLFGSPINTTKDTSVSKKFGRAVSVIVAENLEKASKINESHPFSALETPLQRPDRAFFSDHSENFQQVPDSLDQAFQTFCNPVIDRGPSNIVIESDSQDVKPKKVSENSDIWDFESEPDSSLYNPKATSTVNKNYRSKAMKCLNTQMNSVGKKRTEKKTIESRKEKPEPLEPSVNHKLETLNKTEEGHNLKDFCSSINSTDQHGGSFLPLTSPMASAHERARTRAFSKVIANGIVSVPPEIKKISGNNDIKVENKVQMNYGNKQSARGRKRRNKDLEDENDVEYSDEKPLPKPIKPKALKKEPQVKPTARITRAKKKQAKGVKTAEIIKKTGRENAKAQNTPSETRSPAMSNEEQDKSTTAESTSKNKERLIGEALVPKTNAEVSKAVNPEKKHAVCESTRLDFKDDAKQAKVPHAPSTTEASETGHSKNLEHLASMTSAFTAPLAADTILSEAYTNTLQRQIFESITSFSDQLVTKIHIINDEINKKVMTDLTSKYETLFNDLRDSFQSDVDEMCGFITDVKGLLNLPEKELIDYIKQKKFGTIASKK